MAMTRVWNISPTTTVILDQAVLPGRSVAVDETELELAHKLHREVAAKKVRIGKDSPEEARAILPNTVTRSHVGVPVEAIKQDAPAVVEDKLSENTEEKGYRKNKKHWDSR